VVPMRTSETVTAWNRPRTFVFPTTYALLFAITLTIISMTYYQIYLHYWFLWLTNGYIPRLGMLILPLFYITSIYHLMNTKQLHLRFSNVTIVNTFLAVYLVLSVVSILLNEIDYSSFRVYSFYTIYPILLYLSIVAIVKSMSHTKVILRVIFWLGVCFSLYAMYYFIMYDLTSVMPISTAIGEIRADFGGWFYRTREHLG